MEDVLQNCLVLDFSRLLPGPFCSMILGDHGARVIAIEHRRFRTEYTAVPKTLYRNKEHMTLNLKTQKGKEIFFLLAEKADVILEGFRPGVMDQLGAGYEAVRRVKPGIVYCSITGYGQDGPFRAQVGHDINYLGHSGALSLIGSETGVPRVPGIQVADIVGGLNGAIGILLALLSREKTGSGRHIDISMTDGLLAMLPIAADLFWGQGSAVERGNALLYQRYACYNIYETADGKYVTVGALEPRFWEAVCRFFDVPEYIPLQFDKEKRIELIESLERKFRTRTRDEWMNRFARIDACVGGVLSVPEALAHEHTRARDMTVQMDREAGTPIQLLGNPIKLSGTPAGVLRAPPSFGEDTETILRELGFSPSKIARLKKEDIV